MRQTVKKGDLMKLKAIFPFLRGCIDGTEEKTLEFALKTRTEGGTESL